MKPSYILIAIILLGLPFGVLLWRITAVRNEALQSQPPAQTSDTLPAKGVNSLEELSPEARQASNTDALVNSTLLRGTLKSVAADGQSLVIVHERRDLNQITPVEIAVDLSGINGVVKCWPEEFTMSSGQKIAIKEAYFPITPDKDLVMKDEKYTELQEIATKVVGQYSLIKFFFNFDRETYEASQVVILGC